MCCVDGMPSCPIIYMIMVYIYLQGVLDLLCPRPVAFHGYVGINLRFIKKVLFHQ